MKYINILLILFLLFTTANMQAQSASEIVNNLMEVNKDKLVLTVDDSGILECPADDVINALDNYRNSNSKNERFLVQTIAYKILLNNDSHLVRKEIVDILVDDFIFDEALIRQQASKKLLNFNKNDFNNSHKEKVKFYLENEPIHGLIPVLGVMNLEESKPYLNDIISKGDKSLKAKDWFTSKAWLAHVALARMGEKENIRYCIDRFNTETNEVNKITRVLKDMAYIRNKKTMDILVQVANSEKRLPAMKQGRLGASYADYAVEQILQSVKNPVIKPVGSGYTKDQIDSVRNWSSKRSNLKINR